MHPRIVLADAWRAITRHSVSSLLTVLILAAGFAGCVFAIGMNRAILNKDSPLPNDLVLVGERVGSSNQGILGSLVLQLSSDYGFVATRQSSFLVRQSAAEALNNVDGLWVNRPLFSHLQWPMAMGRDFNDADFTSAADSELGIASVVIISHDYWRSALAGKTDIIDSFITIDGHAQRVIGVLPPYRAYPYQEKIYMPARISDSGTFKDRYFVLLGRMTHTQRDAFAQKLNAMEKRARESKLITPSGQLRVQNYGDNFADAETLVIGKTTVFLGWLLLVLTAINVSGLLLMQWFAKLRESATRSALGCARSMLVASALVHAFLLTSCGLALALLLLQLLLPSFENFLHAQSFGMPQFVRFDLKAGMLLPMMVAVVLCTALVAWPVFLEVRKLDLMQSLRANFTQLGSAKRLSFLLIGAQCLMSMTAVLIALMCARGAITARTQDYGLDGSGVVLARLRSADLTAQESQAQRLLQQLKESPDVQSVSASVALPQVFVMARQMVLADSDIPNNTNRESLGDSGYAEAFPVDENFFATYQIKLLRGRVLQAQDMRSTDATVDPQGVVVIDRAAALRMYGTDDVIGKSFPYLGGKREILRPIIVGVTEEVNLGMSQGKDGPSFFMPLIWNSVRGVGFSIKSTQPDRILRLLNQLAPGLDARVGLYGLETYETGLKRASTGYQILGSLFTPIGILALLLTATGLGATLASIVTQRTRQTAIRRALGAGGRLSIAPILRPWVITLLLGLTLGIALALPIAASLSKAIYNSSGLPIWLIASGFLAILASLALACIPAISRAIKVDPNVVLKQD
jgi:putative ABC transport system permease protein